MKRIIFLLVLSVGVSQAAQFRTFKPIAGPAYKPDDATVVANPRPVARENVERAVSDLLKNWNKPGTETESLLDKDFYDSSRLSDAMDEKVPRDATLRLMSVQGTQTLEQYQRSENGRTIISSVVSVTANTQMEFNDPTKGFRRLEGQNEYIIRIEEYTVGKKP